MHFLFINHANSQCGVYSYGCRLYNILRTSKSIKYDYKEISIIEDYLSINFQTYTGIIYNYHYYPMNWLNSTIMQRLVPNIGISHESPNNLFDFNLFVEPGNANANLGRPLLLDIDYSCIQNTDPTVVDFLNIGRDLHIPIIGSFGFGFESKGFDKIIDKVNSEYDEAIIKFIIPLATYGIDSKQKTEYISNLCKTKITKPNIQIYIIHKYLSDADILYFLNSNTINLFCYDRMEGRSISSVIDFALSVKKPIGITNSSMFRHIYNTSISVEHNSIKQLITQPLDYIYCYQSTWSYDSINAKLESYLIKL